MIELLKTETVHFVKSVKLVSVYVKLLKPLDRKVSETETGFDITKTPLVMVVETISSRTMELILLDKEMDIFNCSFTPKENVLILSVNE